MNKILLDSINIKFISCFALLFASGCISQTTNLKPYTDDERSALYYYQWLNSQPENVLEREKEFLRQQPESLDPIITKARLAIVLSYSITATFADEEKALKLFDQVITQTDSNNSPLQRDYKQFSLLWKDIIFQRRELKSNIKQSGKQVSESNQKLKELEQKNEALVKQIEALKSIEQQINIREQNRDKTQ